MTVVLGAGAGTVAFIGWKISHQPKLPRELEKSRHELEFGIRGVIDACVELSERVRYLSGIVHKLPPEYRGAAQHALRLAKVIEEAAFEEGARHGIFPRPLFSYDGEPPEGTLAPVDSEQDGPGAEIIHLSTAASREWIGGQLMPASAPSAGVSRAGTG